MPESKKSTGRLSIGLRFKKIVESRSRGSRLVPVPLFSRGLLPEPDVEGKPVAKIAPLLILGRLRLGFQTVPPPSGLIKPAMPADPEILSAFGAAQGPPDRVRVLYRRTAIPAHRVIIIRGQDSDKGRIRQPGTRLRGDVHFIGSPVWL
jgi:hypothetical protein